MGRKRFDDMPCPIAQALNQVGDWWTLLIVRDAFLGSRRFSDFHESTGIAKNILTDRLNKLVENEIFVREEVGVRGRRQEYQMTEKGEALLPVLVAMLQWGNKWVCGEGRELAFFVDEASNDVLPPMEVTNTQGRAVDPGRLRAVPGPGAANAA